MDQIISEVRSVALAHSLAYGLRYADAEDIAQEVSIKAWQYLKRGNVMRSVAAWAINATRDQIVDESRKSQSKKRGTELLETCVDIDRLEICTFLKGCFTAISVEALYGRRLSCST